jgi:hypothetical protein
MRALGMLEIPGLNGKKSDLSQDFHQPSAVKIIGYEIQIAGFV